MNTNTEFASANYTAGQLNAVIKLIRKQAGEDGPERFLRGELVVSELPKCWTEKDGVIYFTLPPTEGLTGSQWVTRLERKGFKLSKWAKDVLNSKDFVPTTGVVNNIAVLKGELFSDDDRITSKIVAEGDRRLWKHGKDISPEIACQIREMFTDEEIEAMGLIWITTMHEPISGLPERPRWDSAEECARRCRGAALVRRSSSEGGCCALPHPLQARGGFA